MPDATRSSVVEALQQQRSVARMSRAMAAQVPCRLIPGISALGRPAMRRRERRGGLGSAPRLEIS